MEMIHFQGLNCFHDCVLTIAHSFGLNYSDAFATLWSETDFRYDPYRNAYLTKRLIANLAVMGAKAECFDCFSESDTRDKLRMFRENELMIIGMDAFYIPWNSFYQTFHGPHYFIVRYENADTLACADPTYGIESERIAAAAVVAHTFDIGRIGKVVKKPMQIETITDEAREILRTHPETRQMLLSRIRDCANAEQESIVLLAKYLDAMINNRYMYRFFLEHQSFSRNAAHMLFRDEYFHKWKAAKNGLFKAFVRGSAGEALIGELCAHVSELIDDELAMAEEIIVRPPAASISHTWSRACPSESDR